MKKEKNKNIKNVNKLTFQQKIVKKYVEPVIAESFNKSNYINFCIFDTYLKDNCYIRLDLESYVKLYQIYLDRFNNNSLDDVQFTYDEFVELVYSFNESDIN